MPLNRQPAANTTKATAMIQTEASGINAITPRAARAATMAITTEMIKTTVVGALKFMVFDSLKVNYDQGLTQVPHIK